MVKVNIAFLISLLVMLFSCKETVSDNPPGGGDPDELEQVELQVDNTKRTYWAYSPEEISGKAKIPAIIFFHGSRGSGVGMSGSIRFNTLAEQHNYLAVYPDALVGNWAEGCGCNNADRLQVKDVLFVKQIISDIRGRYPVNTERIYAVGFSQGGLFAGRLGCEMSRELRAVMIVAANMSVPLSQNCNPAEPIPVSFIQGTADDVLPYNGSDNGALSLLSAKEAALFWAEQNNCNTDDPRLSYLPNEDLKSVEHLVYPGNSANQYTNVVLFSIFGGGHAWPAYGVLNTNDEIIQMVQEYD